MRAWRRLRRAAAQLGLGEDTRAAGLLLAFGSLPLALTYFGVQFGLAFVRPAARFGTAAALLSEAASLMFFATVAIVLGVAIWALRARSRT